MTKQYVVGFMFDQNNHDRVALIEKNRPTWQKDKLNGSGGKVEPGEPHMMAMVREFKEETGLDTRPVDWTPYAILTGEGFNISLFACYGPVDMLKTVEDEQIMVFHKDCITADNSIPNLTWLIPLAQRALEHKQYPVLIQE